MLHARWGHTLTAEADGKTSSFCSFICSPCMPLKVELDPNHCKCQPGHSHSPVSQGHPNLSHVSGLGV